MSEIEHGTARVFRGSESLGVVRYRFEIDATGRVTGELKHLEWLNGPGGSYVPDSFLPPRAGVDRDLRVRLGDGRAVDFMVPSQDGRVANGWLVMEHAELMSSLLQAAADARMSLRFEVLVAGGEGQAVRAEAFDSVGTRVWFTTGTPSAIPGAFRAWLAHEARNKGES